MKSTGLTVEWTLVGRGRKQSKAPDSAAGGRPLGKLPRVTRLMALAIKFQDIVDRGEVRDYADLARLGFVTRARITQLMNLLNLAPDIQEQILFFSWEASECCGICEQTIRRMSSLLLWSDQRARWAALTSKLGAAPLRRGTETRG